MSERPSKSAKKREMRDIADLLDKMLQANMQQLEQLPLAGPARSAVLECKHFTDRAVKTSAFSRQKRYTIRLLSEIDLTAVQAIINTWHYAHQQNIKAFHRIEFWRDALLQRDDALGEFLQAYPHADEKTLRGLVQKSRNASIQDKRHQRALFQFVQATLAAAGTQA